MRAMRKGFDFKEYYEKNKEEILKKRAKKYRRDKVYRVSVRKQSKARAARLKDAADPVDRRILQGRHGRRFVSIGILSERINRKIQTIRKYHRERFFPEPSFYDMRGWRLYTQAQARMLGEVFERLDKGNIDREKAKSIIWKRWKE